MTRVTEAHPYEDPMRRAESKPCDTPRRAAHLGLGVLACVALLMVAPSAPLAGESLLALNDKSEPRALPSLDANPSPDGQTAKPQASDDAEAWDDDEWFEDEFSLDDEYDGIVNEDPLEPANRVVFQFNRGVDRFLLTPITGVYQALVPSAGREGVFNVFRNLDSPARLTNAMLQGRPKAAGIMLGRFVFNTTFGLGGLFDVGSRIGLKQQHADFGQTLATWGTPQGPFLIFPFLGPMTVRHGVGMGADFAMQPASWVLGPLPGMIMGASKDFTRREQSEFELEMLRDQSLDFYAALRSAFLQDRADVVASGDEDASLEHMADSGSDSTSAALTFEERKARCLNGPRARREMAKPFLRNAARERCASIAAR